MNNARDAHGMTSFRGKYLIVVGSWHIPESQKSCEIYDIKKNRWENLPDLSENTCAPGLIIVGDRYLYKLGGTSDISKVEMLDLEKVGYLMKQKATKKNVELFESSDDSSSSAVSNKYVNNRKMISQDGPEDDDSLRQVKWLSITTNNKIGNKATINRCLLF